MARIADKVLPNDKQVETALTYIYGIGRSSSIQILKKAKIAPDARVKDLTSDQIQIQVAQIKLLLIVYVVEGKLTAISF